MLAPLSPWPSDAAGALITGRPSSSEDTGRSGRRSIVPSPNKKLRRGLEVWVGAELSCPPRAAGEEEEDDAAAALTRAQAGRPEPPVSGIGHAPKPGLFPPQRGHSLSGNTTFSTRGGGFTSAIEPSAQVPKALPAEGKYEQQPNKEGNVAARAKSTGKRTKTDTQGQR